MCNGAPDIDMEFYGELAERQKGGGLRTEGLSYKGWIINHAMYDDQGKYEASDLDGDYQSRYSDSVGDLMEAIDDDNPKR
jgi:hypothetical protein